MPTNECQETWIFTAQKKTSDKAQALTKAGNLRVIETPLDGATLSIDFVLRTFHEAGVSRVLLEGGAEIAASFLARNLIDEVAWFQSPRSFQGGGLPAPRATQELQDSKHWHCYAREEFPRSDSNKRPPFALHKSFTQKQTHPSDLFYVFRNCHPPRQDRRKHSARPQDTGASKSLCLLPPPTFAKNLKVGASVACNGCCLTLKQPAEPANENTMTLRFGLSPETLARTTLGGLQIGASINLERSLKYGDEIGGHLVSGHIDGVATLIAVEDLGDNRALTFATAQTFAPMLAAKGGIALDGVSLTINTVATDPQNPCAGVLLGDADCP